MPITLVHLGPSLGLALWFRRRLDVVVFFVSSLAVDVEPAILFLLGATTTFYWSHTLVFGTLLGVLLAYLIHFIRAWSVDFWRYFYPTLSWHPGKEASRGRLIFSGVAGVWSHLVLDWLASSEILSLGQVYFFSFLFFLIALFIGFQSMIRWTFTWRRLADSDGYNMV